MKVSSTYLSHRWGGGGKIDSFNIKLFHEQVGNEGAYGGTHGCTMDIFIILTLEEEVCFLKALLQ